MRFLLTKYSISKTLFYFYTSCYSIFIVPPCKQTYYVFFYCIPNWIVYTFQSGEKKTWPETEGITKHFPQPQVHIICTDSWCFVNQTSVWQCLHPGFIQLSLYSNSESSYPLYWGHILSIQTPNSPHVFKTSFITLNFPCSLYCATTVDNIFFTPKCSC